jgi:hypothetical protein
MNIILTPGDVREAVRRGINLRGIAAVVWHIDSSLLHLVPDDDIYGEPPRPLDRIIDDDVAIEA